MFLSHIDERFTGSRHLGQVIVSGDTADEQLDEAKVYAFLREHGTFKMHPPDLKHGVIRRYGSQRVAGDPERWVYEYDATVTISA